MQAHTSTRTAGASLAARGEAAQRPLQIVDWVFAIAVVAVATVRFVILRDGGVPATIDAGNWVAFGDALFGAETRSSTIVYPPVVPLLMKGFVEAFGLSAGVAALGAAASVAPAVGFYVAPAAAAPAGWWRCSPGSRRGCSWW